MERFEANYPITAREAEIKQILQFVTRGQSCQLISVPGAGRSTVIRLLAFHPKLVEYHFNNVILKPKAEESQEGSFANAQDDVHSKNFLFVYVNFAEIPSFDTNELIKFLFLALLSTIEEREELHKKIYPLFKEALKLADPIVLFQNFKKAIQQLNNQAIVFLFDRFSEFGQNLPRDFYASLYSLRVQGHKIPIIFSTHRPLEELLSTDLVQAFPEFLAVNHVFLESYDQPATDFRIGVLEKEAGKKLSPALKPQIIKLTGGHGKLVKLAAQLFLSRSDLDIRSDLMAILLENILIKNSLLEIWQSLPTSQREQSLFPLYDEFIKLGLPQTLLVKTIRFNQNSNDIYFGDQSLTDLTAQEFKLLKFLIDSPNRVIERDEVINAVWADSKTQAGVSDEALDQMVYRVRKKIEDEADNPKHLLTVKGRGFRFLPSLPINQS